MRTLHDPLLVGILSDLSPSDLLRFSIDTEEEIYNLFED